ncbi:hypothetical protein AB4851_24770 [Burkholderia sp. 22PA0099]|uniref:hypothetical protein n=1 Tax=Burkholderia sp. 22PA0099 TaxID=3237372 RepID=UPI0039C30A93
MIDSVQKQNDPDDKHAKSLSQSGNEGKTSATAKLTGLVTLLILASGAAFHAGKQVADVTRDKANAELSADNKVLKDALKQTVMSEQDDKQRVRDTEKELADTRAALESERQLTASTLQRVAVLSEQLGKDTTCAPILQQIEAIQNALSGSNGVFNTMPPEGDQRKELLGRLADWQKQLTTCHGG